MRVLQVVSASDINGAATHALSVARQLRRRGHDAYLACPPDAWLATQFPSSQIIETTMSRWPLDESRRIAAIARDLGIEVTHTHQSRAHSFGVMLRWLFGIPSVATAHNCRIQLHWALNHRVIGVSEQTTRFHRRFNAVGRRQIATIHNFVDVEQFQFNRGSRDWVREELGIAPSRTVGVVLGTIMRKKGLHYAIEALPSILRQAPEFHLLIVGSPRPRDLPYQEQLQRQAKHLGVEHRITWAGPRNDVAALLNSADLLVSASLEENFPISVLEAMACGLPVVATRVGGVPELVVDGVTGRLVSPKDVTGLTRAATELCDTSRKHSMGVAARNRVVTHFSADSQMPKLETVLRAAANRQRTPITWPATVPAERPAERPAEILDADRRAMRPVATSAGGQPELSGDACGGAPTG